LIAAKRSREHVRDVQDTDVFQQSHGSMTIMQEPDGWL
jgi:hypothetical protein